MTERDRLMAALFDRPGKEHIDVKFFIGSAVDLQSEEFCAAAANMIEVMHSSEADEEFAEAV